MLLVFYPYAFSDVCTGEMAQIRDRLDEFMTFDSEVLAISCDPMYALRAFADQRRPQLPAALGLLAARRGLPRLRRLRRGQGSRRAGRRTSSTSEGMVRWAVHNPTPDGRDLDEHLRQLHLVADEVA